MSDILGSNVIVIKTPDSIVSGTTSNPVDFFQPLTFTQWIIRSNVSETDSNYLLEQYKLYLLKWYKTKNFDDKEQENYVRSAYIGLLREIVLSYSTLEERRFVTNADFTNDLDLYSVLPFFVKKIKTICEYYRLLRESVKSKKYENSLKGSQFGVETVVLNEIIKSLNALDVIRTDNISFNLSSIKNNISLTFHEFFDDSQYLDINPEKNYNDYNEGTKPLEYSSNLNNFDPTLFNDFEQSIINAIKSYPFFLSDFKTNYSVNVQVTADDLQYLKDKDFINQINNNNKDNLNLQLEKQLIEKFIGTDYYYLSTGSTTTNYVSGLLFEAEDKAANFLNKRFPSTATVPNDDTYLKNIRDIGGYFLPDKLGILNFNTLKYSVTVNTDSLEPNKLYVFPDPSKYGNISNLSKTDFETPFIYEEDVSWMHYNRSAQYIFGNIKSNPLLKDFYGYHSRNQTVGYQPFGMSRDIDSTEFFTGTAKDVWENTDVFPIVESVYPLDARQENLLVKNKTLVQYKTDVYGNNYGLYKEINPVGVGPAGTNFGDFISQGELDFFNFTGGRGGLYGTGRRGLSYNQFEELKEQGIKPCLILDGHVYFDIDEGFNFNYKIVNPDKRYSGVFTRTVTQIPPGSGYFTSGPTFTSFAADPFANYYVPFPYTPPPSFKPLDFPLLLIAYGQGRFLPDEFCDTFTISYCLVLDCITFVDKNSNILNDFSSDSPSWNTSIPVYYNELLECSLNTFLFKPDTVSRPATFSYTYPVSTGQTELLNAYNLNLEGQTPCEVSFSEQTSPNLEYRYDKRDFKNLPIPIENNTAVQSLSTTLTRPRSIYESRYQEKGEFYVKNANTTRVDLVTEALSSIFNKYDEAVRVDIENGVYTFELFYNVILIETENYLILDKIDYDYANNLIIPYNSERNYLRTFNIDRKLEKISVPYFRESDNKVFIAKTTLFYYNSCLNEKLIYPEIYTIDLNNPTFTKVYPDTELTFENLSSFISPLSNFYIDKLDKPIISYNEDSNTFILNYFVKNPNDVFINTLFEFRIDNTVFSFLKKYMYVPTFRIKDYNYCDNQPVSGVTITSYNLSAVAEDGFLYFAASSVPVFVGSRFERCIDLPISPTPTPTNTPSPTPSITPTPTPTLTPTASPLVCANSLVVGTAGTSEVTGIYTLSTYLGQPVYMKWPFMVKYYTTDIPDDSLTSAIISGATDFEGTTGFGTAIYATSSLRTVCLPVGEYNLPSGTYSPAFSANVPLIGEPPYPVVSIF